ncbi:MAG: hypothetical protein JSU75_05645 [Gammaproteobacteria bacterium]|nr:MAG: hypothetical protein JSU75_05645 [Gammaproteobacteria bacterium]
MSENPDNEIVVQHPDVPDSPALQALLQGLRQEHGKAVNGILFYGSCLRSGNPLDGLVDLYLLVDSYPAFYTGKLRALANWLLPPNVFYTERQTTAGIVRAKYAVLSSTDLESGCSRKWFHSYLWGRFCQPTALAWHRDEASRTHINACREAAVRTFLERVLPRLPESGSIRDLWQQGLQLSYAAELRVEKSGRAAELADAASGYYVAATRKAVSSLRYPLRIEGDGKEAMYHANIGTASRLVSRISWPARQVQGKILSVLRLLKALFTFEGGLDYLAWKLERHSGQPVEIPERVRRYPLIFIWGLFWQLYRRGIFR